MRKKILIAVGGSGGHVIPACACANDLKEISPSLEILFAGQGLSQNTYLLKNAFAKVDIPSASLSFKQPLSSLKNVKTILQGIKQARKVIYQFMPDVVIGFGSFHTLPVMLAAAFCSIPIILYAADTVPGKVIRLMSSFAQVTAIHFEEAAHYVRGNTSQVLHPLRASFKKEAHLKENAYHYFGLDSYKYTLLVFGGSQGAFFLNQLVQESILKAIEKVPNLQIIHITGSLEASEKAELFYKLNGICAAVKTYEPNIDLAWQIADLSITRAGASTLAEQLAMEVPGILIPYPHAADQHQNKNANFMVWEVKAAIKFLEGQISSDLLAEKISAFFAKDQELIKKMQYFMKIHKQNQSPTKLADLVLSCISKV